MRKDGTPFWANVLITAVFNDAGEHVGFTKVTRDTSAQRRLEEEREHAVQSLATVNSELEALNNQLQESARRTGPVPGRHRARAAHADRRACRVGRPAFPALERTHRRRTAGPAGGMSTSVGPASQAAGRPAHRLAACSASALELTVEAYRSQRPSATP